MLALSFAAELLWVSHEVGTGTSTQWDPFSDFNLDELRDPGDSRTTFMLRLTLSHPGLHTTIVGTTNPDHLRENVEAAAKGPLAADVVAEAMQRLTN